MNTDDVAPWIARMKIKAGDPLFVPCRKPELQEFDHDDDITVDANDWKMVQNEGVCINIFHVKDLSFHGNGLFANWHFSKDEIIFEKVPLLHLHRTELRGEDGTFEDLWDTAIQTGILTCCCCLSSLLSIT